MHRLDMTLSLSVKCNRCGNVEDISLEQIIGIAKQADQQDKPLSDITYRCGECHAKDASESIERIFSKGLKAETKAREDLTARYVTGEEP